MAHIWVNKLTNIRSDNGLSPSLRQAITWTNASILLIGPLVPNFIEILEGIHTFSFKKMHLKMSSTKWRPFCLGFNVLIYFFWRFLMVYFVCCLLTRHINHATISCMPKGSLFNALDGSSGCFPFMRFNFPFVNVLVRIWKALTVFGLMYLLRT